jgi:hypothetical protein
MIEFIELTPEHREKLRRERLLALEADHYRIELLLAEEVEPKARGAFTEQLIEYRRRIDAHVGRPETDAAGEHDAPAD